jgi:hypothetical protein
MNNNINSKNVLGVYYNNQFYCNDCKELQDNNPNVVIITKSSSVAEAAKCCNCNSYIKKNFEENELLLPETKVIVSYCGEELHGEIIETEPYDGYKFDDGLIYYVNVYNQYNTCLWLGQQHILKVLK